jgi:alpha-beta hydrolase superfamily lysophospholipase
LETLEALVRADERPEQNFARLTLPLLVLHGAADKAANASGGRHVLETAGSSDKTLKLRDGVVHDPLNDHDKTSVMRDITQWIEARLAT